jgi:hypothetical protein
MFSLCHNYFKTYFCFHHEQMCTSQCIVCNYYAFIFSVLLSSALFYSANITSKAMCSRGNMGAMGWETRNRYHLFQCCPTLSPFATCGDKRFECGDRQLFRTGFLMVNKLQYLSNSDKSGDRKTFVATIVANVATERMRLDTTDLYYTAVFSPGVNFTDIIAQNVNVPVNILWHHSGLPTKLCATMSVHSTMIYAQLLHCILYAFVC